MKKKEKKFLLVEGQSERESDGWVGVGGLA
jgi:hypothetical protein